MIFEPGIILGTYQAAARTGEGGMTTDRRTGWL
jgi:hypothetical protein